MRDFNKRNKKDNLPGAELLTGICWWLCRCDVIQRDSSRANTSLQFCNGAAATTCNFVTVMPLVPPQAALHLMMPPAENLTWVPIM